MLFVSVEIGCISAQTVALFSKINNLLFHYLNHILFRLFVKQYYRITEFFGYVFKNYSL